MATRVTLSIKDSSIIIPYAAAAREEEPHEGFIALKGQPELADTILAAKESEALKQALVRVNAPSTPFFTVACRKVVNQENGYFWVRGYLEFALNYEEVAKDSPNYFLLFEQFTHHVRNVKLDLPVDFSFELHEAEFIAIEAKGHSACVWITTAEFPQEEAAAKAWNQSIGFLSEFLGSYETLDLPEIYPS